MSAAAATPREPATDTRADILEAALRLYAARGSQAVTIRAVADATGCTAPTIYWHFGDKSGLLAEVYGAGFRDLAASLHAALDEPAPMDQLWAAIRIYRDFALDNPQAYTTMFTTIDPDRALEDGDARRPGRQAFDFLLARVKACTTDALLPTSLDARALAIAIWSTAHGMVSLQISGRLGLSRARFSRMFDDTLGFLLDTDRTLASRRIAK